MQTEEPPSAAEPASRLSARGKKLIDAIRGQYSGVPVGAEFTAPATTVGVKSGG